MSTEKENSAHVIIASHERSGTHFLINSLNTAFGLPEVQIDYDYHSLKGLNFFHRDSVRKAFQRLSAYDNPVKSHHTFDFFRPVIGDLLANFVILYIYREPRTVLRSFRRFLHRWPWYEGPLVATDRAFLRIEPSGQMLRYQMFQQPTMLHRWGHHVRGWLEAANEHRGIHLIRFEELDDNYEQTIAAVGAALGLAPRSLQKPARTRRQISTIPSTHPAYDGGEFDSRDEALVSQMWTEVHSAAS